jgi:hypothetical protein
MQLGRHRLGTVHERLHVVSRFFEPCIDDAVAALAAIARNLQRAQKRRILRIDVKPDDMQPVPPFVVALMDTLVILSLRKRSGSFRRRE